MRYTELIESTSSDELTQTLQRDCGPFLQAINNRVHNFRIYRGMFKRVDGYTKKQVRLDGRDPMSTSTTKHDQINTYFTNTFSEPFRNALFVSGDEKQAKSYGHTSIIFPVGDFTFLWAPEVHDMAITLAGSWPVVNGWNVPPKQPYTDELMSKYNYTTKDFVGAIKSGQEIMIRCKEYYAIDPRLFSDLFR